MSDLLSSFVPLDISHKPVVAGFTSQFEPYSDFHFTSLISWASEDNLTGFTFLDDNLIIKQPDYLSGNEIISLIGENNINETVEKLFEVTDELKLVPEVTARLIDSSRYLIEEDIDNHDYIYDLSKISKLEGKQYKKKRNKINATLCYLSDNLEVKNHKYLNDTLTQGIMRVFDVWSESSRQSDSETQLERKALQKLIANANELGVITTVAYIDNDIVAFSINEIVNSEYAICHFEKTVPVHAQFASTFAVKAAESLFANGCKFVNWEQDLGIEGLRQSKQSFQPHKYLKKYVVKKR